MWLVAIPSPQHGLLEVGKKAATALRTHEKCLDVSARKLTPGIVSTKSFQGPWDLGTALTGSIFWASLYSLPCRRRGDEQH